VRHGYRPGWHFPGGGVEFNETIETALARELLEEAGIVVEAPPKLFGIYANFHAFRGDHIALFIIETWSQPQVPAPGHEIAEHGFFALDALPDDIAAGTRARLDEIFAGARRSSLW
jgi:8-oxo-dGTP pyrophosphatase MutT (NUDIX family)